MHKKLTSQNLLRNWVDAREHFEQGLISESAFLRAQTRAMEAASKVIPRNAKEAAAQLIFAVMLWKEEVITPTTPTQIAMDKMMGHVVGFLGE